MILRETEDVRIVVRKTRVIEIDKATGSERELGEVEADREWDRFERYGKEGKPNDDRR